MCLAMRLDRIVLRSAAIPTARAPPKTMVDQSETPQLFLKRGRKDAEGCGRALLIPARREQRGGDDVSFETDQKIAEQRTIGLRLFSTRGRIRSANARQITRHAIRIGQTDAGDNGLAIHCA
jgi:hypothetical protein